MTLETLLTKIEDFKEFYEQISGKESDIEDCLKEYDATKHDITKRPDKWITIPDPAAPEGSDRTIDQKVTTAKLTIPYQEIIVTRRAAFLCGIPITLDHNSKEPLQQDLVDVTQKLWDDNKMDYESKAILEILMSEKEVAELYYIQKVDDLYWAGTPNENATNKVRARLKILAKSHGDILYPIKDVYGDMIAFGREYAIPDDAGKDETHFDLYTNDNYYEWTSDKDGKWSDPTVYKNDLGKIPVIYHSQPKKEWEDVQRIIERDEFSHSLHCDINDYNAAPTKVVTGRILGWSKKAEAGSVLQIDPNAKVEILSWNQAPESLKLEQDNNRSLIFDMTDTPDISFSQMKSLFGSAPSSYAMKGLFMAAHMRASKKEELYGKGVQRRINLLKAINLKINPALQPAAVVNIKPKFTYFLPNNDAETIDMLATAKTAKTLSDETIVRNMPFVQDAENELKLLREQATAMQGSLGLDTLMNQ